MVRDNTGINVRPDFVLAGNSIFTVSNGLGTHYTFNVYKSKPTAEFPDDAWFIKVLMGGNNTLSEDYAYIGKLEWKQHRTSLLGAKVTLTDQPPSIKLTRNSKWKQGEIRVNVASWALRCIWQVAAGMYDLPAGFSIQHIGRCGRCGAALTTPESLSTGLGPVCAELAGVEWKERNGRQPELVGVREEGK